MSSSMTGKSLTQTLQESGSVVARIAANSVKSGMEFEDEDAVKNAIAAFSKEKQFTYIKIENSAGKEIFRLRKDGLPEIHSDNLEELNKSSQEWFTRVPVLSDSKAIGKLTLGISLKQRNAHLADSRTAMLIALLLMTALFAVITVLVARKIADPIKQP